MNHIPAYKYVHLQRNYTYKIEAGRYIIVHRNIRKNNYKLTDEITFKHTRWK